MFVCDCLPDESWPLPQRRVVAPSPTNHVDGQAIYQNATMQAALRRADFVGQERDRQGLQALAVDPREHERATPPLDALLPPPVGQAQPRHGDGYRPGEYRIETEGYAVKDYKSIYD